MTEPGIAWHFPVRVEDVPETGAHFDLVADETVRADLMRVAALRELPRLTASFDVVRHGADGLHVSGEVSATVGQNCVVSLEPVESDLNEFVDLAFVPGESGAGADARAEASVGFDQDEPPETLSDGALDLAAIAVEFFLLGIDPYPRKPGAVFAAQSAGDPAAHPFAALAALKKDRDGKR